LQTNHQIIEVVLKSVTVERRSQPIGLVGISFKPNMLKLIIILGSNEVVGR